MHQLHCLYARHDASIYRANRLQASARLRAVSDGDTSMDFVLDRVQVDDLIAYLRMARHRLLKPPSGHTGGLGEGFRMAMEDAAKKLEAASSKRSRRKAPLVR